jgi:hypothetical protein
MVVKLFHTDGRTESRTDLSKPFVAFYDFVNDRKFLLSAPSPFPSIWPQIKERTACLNNYVSVNGREQHWLQQL